MWRGRVRLDLGVGESAEKSISGASQSGQRATHGAALVCRTTDFGDGASSPTYNEYGSDGIFQARKTELASFNSLAFNASALIGLLDSASRATNIASDRRIRFIGSNTLSVRKTPFETSFLSPCFPLAMTGGPKKKDRAGTRHAVTLCGADVPLALALPGLGGAEAFVEGIKMPRGRRIRRAGETLTESGAKRSGLSGRGDLICTGETRPPAGCMAKTSKHEISDRTTGQTTSTYESFVVFRFLSSCRKPTIQSSRRPQASFHDATHTASIPPHSVHHPKPVP